LAEKMTKTIASKSRVQLGVVPTHLKFVGGLVPDENGRIPRNENEDLLIVANMKKLCEQSKVRVDCVQIPFFPGLNEGDVESLVGGLQGLDLDVHYILMVGGADPMNPADEDAVVAMLVEGLKSAHKHGVKTVSSTSIEEWMKSGATAREGDAFEEAVAQNVQVHTRAVNEAGASSIGEWHIEFLRGGEFQTFTDIGRCWKFVSAANPELGEKLLQGPL
jgi:hypothetical protein